MAHKMITRPDGSGTPRVSFWYDPDTPRNTIGKKEAKERLAIHKGITTHTLERLHPQAHHINLDRKLGGADEFFICIDDKKTGRTANQQHANLHNQLHAKNIFEMRTGLMKFDREKKMYYLGEELEPIYRAAAKRIKEQEPVDDESCRSIGELIAKA